MLTDKQIQKTISNARADAMLNDGARGKGGGSLRLKIRVGKRGTNASWFAWWQIGGKPMMRKLGEYPAMSLGDARTACAGVIENEKNPAAKRAAPADRTVGKLFAGYINAMRQDGKSSATEVEGRLAVAAAALGIDKAASDVTAAEVSDFLKAIHDRGARVMADRMRAYLSAAFNWGLEAENDYRAKVRQNWGIKINPAASVKRDTAANTTRERNLSADELARLWLAADGPGFAGGTGAAIRLLICCGQRILETMRVDGADIDLDAALWTMPARKTKGGTPHMLPLPAQAMPIFRALIDKHDNGPLFPARWDQDERQLGTSLNKAMRRWSRLNAVEDFQGRDLRRTWKTRTADAGIDRFMRDVIQQHARGGDTGSKHYDRASYLPQMRAAMKQWELWLDKNVLKSEHKSENV